MSFKNKISSRKDHFRLKKPKLNNLELSEIISSKSRLSSKSLVRRKPTIDTEYKDMEKVINNIINSINIETTLPMLLDFSYSKYVLCPLIDKLFFLMKEYDEYTKNIILQILSYMSWDNKTHSLYIHNKYEISLYTIIQEGNHISCANLFWLLSSIYAHRSMTRNMTLDEVMNMCIFADNKHKNKDVLDEIVSFLFNYVAPLEINYMAYVSKYKKFLDNVFQYTKSTKYLFLLIFSFEDLDLIKNVVYPHWETMCRDFLAKDTHIKYKNIIILIMINIKKQEPKIIISELIINEIYNIMNRNKANIEVMDNCIELLRFTIITDPISVQYMITSDIISIVSLRIDHTLNNMLSYVSLFITIILNCNIDQLRLIKHIGLLENIYEALDFCREKKVVKQLLECATIVITNLHPKITSSFKHVVSQIHDNTEHQIIQELSKNIIKHF